MHKIELYNKLVAARIPESFNYFRDNGVVYGLEDYRRRILALDGIPGFDDDVKSLKESIVFRTALNEVSVPREEFAKMQIVTKRLLDGLKGLQLYIKATVASTPQNAIHFKLPDGDDFDAVLSDMEKVKSVVQQMVLLPGVGGKFEVGDFENGSKWFTILVGVPAAVSILVVAGHQAMSLVQETQKQAALYEQVRRLSLGNDALEDIVQAQKKLLDGLVEKSTMEIADKHAVSDHEAIARVRVAIKDLMDLYERGSTIYPSLMSSAEVKAMSPNLTSLGLLRSAEKPMLEDSKGGQAAKGE